MSYLVHSDFKDIEARWLTRINCVRQEVDTLEESERFDMVNSVVSKELRGVYDFFQNWYGI